jgi:hypothetical protein
MFRLSPLRQPDEKADQQRKAEQDSDGLEEAERQQRPSDRDPWAFIDRHRNSETGVIEGLGEIDMAVTCGRHGDRCDTDIEGAVRDAIDEVLHALGLDQTKAQACFVGDPSPEFDADPAPASVVLLDREGRSFLGSHRQFRVGCILSAGHAAALRKRG